MNTEGSMLSRAFEAEEGSEVDRCPLRVGSVAVDAGLISVPLLNCQNEVFAVVGHDLVLR